MVADESSMQYWAADYGGEGRVRAARDSGYSGMVMMDAAAEDGCGGR
jgi:hypothetical protein